MAVLGKKTNAALSGFQMEANYSFILMKAGPGSLAVQTCTANFDTLLVAQWCTCHLCLETK